MLAWLQPESLVSVDRLGHVIQWGPTPTIPALAWYLPNKHWLLPSHLTLLCPRLIAHTTTTLQLYHLHMPVLAHHACSVQYAKQQHIHSGHNNLLHEVNIRMAMTALIRATCALFG